MSRPGWQDAELTDDLDVDWPSSASSGDEDDEHEEQEEGSEDMSLDLNPPPASIRVSASPSDSAGLEAHLPDTPTPPGTFVMHSRAPATPLAPQAAAKSFFSPLKLETMFRPPEPSVPAPVVPAAPAAAAHNAHRARRPSRLSQVHLPEPPTPSAASFVIESPVLEERSGMLSQELGQEQEQEQEEEDDQYEEEDEDERKENEEEEQEEEYEQSGADEIVETDIPNLGAFDGRLPSSSFRFTFPVPPRPRNPSPPSTQASASPSPGPPNMSTPTPARAADPRLRLFQLQYDTYTRAHLSALVDSIGVESATPTPSPAASGTPGFSTDAEEEREGEEDREVRSRKRIRLSPAAWSSGNGQGVSSEAGRGVPGQRDYLRESKDLMQAIRGARTVSNSSGGQDTRTVPTTEIQQQEQLLRVPSPDLRTSTRSSLQRAGSPEKDTLPSLPSSQHGGAARPAPTSSSSDPTHLAPPAPAADLSRYVSSASAPTARTASSSSRTSGASNTIPSYTKHAGPPAIPSASPPAPSVVAAPARVQMRSIRPEDVAGVLADTVGGMVYDREQMRWMRRRSAGGMSAGSEDVFGSLGSFGDEEGGRDEQRAAGVRVEVKEGEEKDVGKDERETVKEMLVGEESIPSPPPQLLVLPTLIPATPLPLAGPSTPAPAQRNMPPAPPRSALKANSGSSSNPSSGHAATPRSVSFSDGRKFGPIAGLGRNWKGNGNRGKENEEAVASDSEEDGDAGEVGGVGEATFLGTASGAASMRTRRIMGLLEGLQEMSMEDEDNEQEQHDEESEEESLQSPTRPTRSRILIPRPSPPSPRSPASRYKAANQTFLTECSFGVAHDALVAYIMDAQPYEPFWEQLVEISLRGKGVESVARLKEFLPAVERVDLDDNQIAWLTGLPGTVRSLSVASNLLTGLTAYTHIRKLEYLNISRNQVDSVQQLAGLSNLRELIADHNSIDAVDGLFGLPLVKLSLRGNVVKRLDLARCGWVKLEHLDLSQNGLSEVLAVDRLEALRSLNLEDNALSSFALQEDRALAHLLILRMSGNVLANLSVRGLPALRTLYADNNRLKEVTGLKALRKLENLSLRNQQGHLRLNLKDVRDVKRLYLSGNPLPRAFFSSPLYCLLYLELAACRLSSLPSLQTVAPNVRALNLNYNFFTDLGCLRGLDRLRKLTIVGSRIPGVRAMANVVRDLKDLELLDLRMNPCTLGWYLPILVSDIQSALQPGAKPKLGSDVCQVPFAQLDTKHRRDLPNELYVARLAWRGLVMRSCPGMRTLDGLEVTERERVKTGRLLAQLAQRTDGEMVEERSDF